MATKKEIKKVKKEIISINYMLSQLNKLSPPSNRKETLVMDIVYGLEYIVDILEHNE